MTNWKVQETCFDDLHHDPNWGTLLSTGHLKEIAHNMKQLAKHETISEENLFDASLKSCTLFITFQGVTFTGRCSFLKKNVYEEFLVYNRTRYNPDKFENLCHFARVLNSFFTIILNATTDPWNLFKRQHTNRKRTAIRYKLIYPIGLATGATGY